MAVYKVADYIVSSDDEIALQEALAGSYGLGTEDVRPRCLCRREEPGNENHEGIPMYIAHVNDKYVIKRMPNSAQEHTAACDSYEFETGMTGYGALLGSAIQEGPEVTILKPDYSLTEGGGRGPSVSEVEIERSEVEASSPKLTLRSTLHYLWTAAGLTKWIPGFAGKRTWKTVVHLLNAAVKNKTIKGTALGEVLYIPETYSVERKDEIALGRVGRMRKIASGDTGKKRLMLLVAEFKEFKAIPSGHNLVVEQMPDFPFLMDENFKGDYEKAFRLELELHRQFAGHLMVIATFSFSRVGTATLKKASAMLVDDHWLPYEDDAEKSVIDTLVNTGRTFEVLPRFNKKWDTARPSLFLTDTSPKPWALYIIPEGVTDDYHAQRLAQASNNLSYMDWHWDPGSEPIKHFPYSREEEKRLDTQSWDEIARREKLALDQRVAEALREPPAPHTERTAPPPATSFQPEPLHATDDGDILEVAPLPNAVHTAEVLDVTHSEEKEIVDSAFDDDRSGAEPDVLDVMPSVYPDILDSEHGKTSDPPPVQTEEAEKIDRASPAPPVASDDVSQLPI